MPYFVVWDCETDTLLPKGTGKLERDLAIERSEVTVLCCLVFDSSDALQPDVNWEEARKKAKEYTFWRDVAKQGEGPFDGALALFDDAEAIVAYNGLGFDMCVVSKYYGMGKKSQYRRMTHRMKLLDPMTRISDALDVRYPGLNHLLWQNGLAQKTSHGVEAIGMWERGERERLQDYCMKDVEALSKLVLLRTIKYTEDTTLPNAVHGVASFVLAQRAVAALPTDGDWTLVEAGAAFSA